MYLRLSRLVLCLFILNIGCHSNRTPPNIPDDPTDPTSGNVVVEPLVVFADIPEYNGDQLTFKVEAKNDATSSFVYSFQHGQGLSCDNSAATWISGNFGNNITIDDKNDYGARLICIRGVDAKGKMSTISVPSPFKKEAPQDATTSIDVAIAIANDMMSVSKAEGSAATGFKWCVVDEQDGCPTPDENAQNQYSDSGSCTFTDGTSLPQGNIDLNIGDKAAGSKLKACVVGIGGDRQVLIELDFTKNGQSVDTNTDTNTEQPDYPANNGQLVALSTGTTGYYIMGRNLCSTMPFFKNTGTDPITVKFSYRNDSGLNRERREQMFSDLIYQVYAPADHIQVREALLKSYCRRGELGDDGKVLNAGDTFTLPAGQQVITIFKAKDPTSMNHDAKYFNARGYACIQMRLIDLNNDKSIDRYRCARRSELALYIGNKNKKLERGTSGEYVVEISLSKGSKHRKFNVVNATMEKAITDGVSREAAEEWYSGDLIWKIAGYTDENVPNWFYYVGENFSKMEDGKKKVITAENQFQIGIRGSVIADGRAAMPAAGDSYRLLLLSNSLSDSPCQEDPPVTYITKHVNARGENRKDKEVGFWFCPRADVLNIKIVQ